MPLIIFRSFTPMPTDRSLCTMFPCSEFFAGVVFRIEWSLGPHTPRNSEIMLTLLPVFGISRRFCRVWWPQFWPPVSPVLGSVIFLGNYRGPSGHLF
ncbi:hypothetical protein AYI70_g9688 [Smittium culicis]|uniref:Uncharacterized protein n=1 Tax=Smittium culicis TaxID=133412 RepID=A0A1R1XA44_9FUNG|nr:hypothetical protein AYI70_g9688 [Smittium culicis]